MVLRPWAADDQRIMNADLTREEPDMSGNKQKQSAGSSPVLKITSPGRTY